MEIIDSKEMKMHETEFRLMTRKVGSGTRIDLFRVVNGVEEPLFQMLDSYKQGMEYLENDYMQEYREFTRFTAILSGVIQEKLHMFDFDPPGWEEEMDSSMRHLSFEYRGEMVVVEVCVKIATGYNRVMTAEVDWIQVLNDQELDGIVSRFSYDLFRKFDELFTEKLVA